MDMDKEGHGYLTMTYIRDATGRVHSTNGTLHE